MVGDLLPLSNDVTSENANSATYKVQTIHRKCDADGNTLMHTHLHAWHHCVCSKADKSDFSDNLLFWIICTTACLY